MSGHIVVVGSLNMDLVVHAPRLPKLGETVLGNGFQTFPGGKGANQSVAAARLGAQVKMIGCVGDDAFGAALRNNLLQDGVDVALVRPISEAPTGVALITVDEAGHNTIVVNPGANGCLMPSDILAGRQAFDGAAALLAQLECPLDTVQQAMALARQQGTPVVLNPAPAQALEPAFFAQIDYLIPNQVELNLLTRCDDIDAAVARVHDWGVKNVIVTLGEEGVLISDGRDSTKLPAHQVSVIDTTAAGDAFVGAFAVAITHGRNTLEAARWGNAAGALAVTRPGAQPSLPRAAEVQSLLARAA
jgi:ribokinase